ncbi:serine/arginine repetitive matrix protein 2-like isoform X2 [Cotesia glomerata]|uniref:serine/arginine repetitive matrix protein 2-like isoform X2 n=1 Tax=Cotesia glomerata TaxID=32391 RepID=UPI001D005603|nr:serine/arginine repetitive matrix protein 2-like isoform X2 [Cotesia glomerata]
MENTSETVENNGDISFGEARCNKCEKYKIDFLCLKSKIFKSKELIEKYKILKENLYRAKECTKEKEKLLESERSANKAFRLKMNSEKLAINTVTKEKSQLIKQIEELDTKLQAQTKYNEQLSSKIEELENEYKEKLMDKDLKLSGLKLDNQELKKKLQAYQKKDPKLAKKMELLEKQKKLKKSQPFNSTRHTGLVDLSALDNVSEEPGNSPEHEVDIPLEQEVDISLEDISTRDQGTDTCDLSFEVVPAPRKRGSKKIMRNMECQVGPKLQDQSTITENVSRRQELYPLYCKECHKSLGPKPIDEILNTMTSLSPKLDAIEPPEAPRRSLPFILPSTSTYNDDVTQNAVEIARFASRQDGGQVSQNGGEKIEKRLGRIEKQLKGLQKGQAPCCGHTGGGDLQVNLLTTLLEKVLRKSPVKRKRKELKGRVAKKKVKRNSRVHEKSSRSRKKKRSRMSRSSSRSSSDSLSSENSSSSESSRISSSLRSSSMSRSLSRSSRKSCSRNRKGSSSRNLSRVGSRNRNSPSPKNNKRSLDSRSRNLERSIGSNFKNLSRSSSRNCNGPSPSSKNNKRSRSKNREPSVGYNSKNPSRSSSRNCHSPSPSSKNNKRSNSSSSQNRNQSRNRERFKSLSKELTPRSSSKDSILSRVRKPRRRLISDDELEPFQEPTNSESDISVPKFKNPVSAVKNRPNPEMFSPDLISKTINNTLEVPEPKRKGTKGPKTTAQVQTQLLKKLRKLKTNKPATTPCSGSLTPTEVCEVTKRKRIAHVPKEQGEVTQPVKKRKTRSMAAKKSDCSGEIPKDVMEPENGTENKETKVLESSSPKAILLKEVPAVKRRGRPPKNKEDGVVKKKYTRKTVPGKKAVLESSEASDNVPESLKEVPSENESSLEAENSRKKVLEGLEPEAAEGSEVLESSKTDVENSDVSTVLEKFEVLDKPQAMETSDTPVVENSKESLKVLESSSDQTSKVVESLNSETPDLLEKSIPERSSALSLEALESSDEENSVIERSNVKTSDIKETPELLESSTVKSSEGSKLADIGLPLLDSLIDETLEHEHSVNSPEVMDSLNTESPASPDPEGSIEANLTNILTETSAEPNNLELEPKESNVENILKSPESPDPTSDELILDTATSSESPEISLGIDIAMNIEISEEDTAVRSELKDMVVESSSEASDIEMDVETTLEPASPEPETEVPEIITDTSENATISVPKILEPIKLVTVPRMLPKTIEKPCKSNKPIALGRKSSNAKMPEVIVTKPDSEVLESQNSSMNTRTLRSRTVSISPSRVLPKIRRISPTKNLPEVPLISPGTLENDSKPLESRILINGTAVPRTLVPGITSLVTNVPGTLDHNSSVPGTAALKDSVPATPVPRTLVPGSVTLENSVPGTSVPRTMEPPLTTEILLKNSDSHSENSNVPNEHQRQRSIQNLLDFYLLTRTTPVIIQNSGLHRNVAIMLSDSATKKIITEFQRFLDSEWTCELNNSLIANLRNLEPVSIASALVEVLKERAELHEPLSYEHTPPAPPMTVSQHKFIGFLAKFEIERPGTMEHVMVIIAQSLFKIKTNKDDDEIDVEALQALSRFFILITKIKKDRERARIFLCDALYALQKKTFYILHIFMTCWAEVIPRYDESTMSFLPKRENLTQNGGQGTQNGGSEQDGGQVNQTPSFYSEISETLPLKTVGSPNGGQGSQNGGRGQDGGLGTQNGDPTSQNGGQGTQNGRGRQNDVIETRKKYLVISIATVIKNHRDHSKNDNISQKIINVKRLLKTLYNYPDEFISTKVIENLLEALKVKRDNSCLIAAIVLLAKREGSNWTSQHVVPKLVKMVDTGGARNNAYDILTLLGYILRPFPLNDESKQVENVINRLCQILDAKTDPVEFQEGAAMALMSLARNNFAKSAPTLLRWRPSRPITGELKTKLQHWFESRTPQYWNQFLKNNDLTVGKGSKLK